MRRTEWARLTVATAATVLAALALRDDWTDQTSLALTNWLATVAFAGAAIMLAREPGQAGNARMFAATTVFWTSSLLSFVPHIGPLVVWFGTSLVFVFLAVVLLRYPEQRLRTLERRYVLILAGWIIGSRTVWAAVSEPEWHGYPADTWWPALVPNRAAHAVADMAFNVVALGLTAAFLVLVGRRLRRRYCLDRRTLIPVVASAMATGVVVCVDVAARMLAPPSLMPAVLTVEAAVMMTVPAAFLAATVHGRFARAAVADLVVRLSATGTIESVRDGLREALCDPSLDILYWVPQTCGYVDSAGRRVDPPADRQRLVMLVRTAEREPLALITADPALRPHRHLLDAAVAAGALTLENARLQADVRAQMEQIRASRARIVEAGMAARRRIERDLHDGAQQRLLALKLTLAAARANITEPAARITLDHARAELAQTLTELRDLAHGIHPAVLAQGGLPAALDDLIDRFPLRIRIQVPPRRFPVAAEATAYFVILEALTDVADRPGAACAGVTVEEHGGHLRVIVEDDDVDGFADGRPGLTAIRDRVAAIGGEVTVTSDAAAGTRLEARIPCA